MSCGNRLYKMAGVRGRVSNMLEESGYQRESDVALELMIRSEGDCYLIPISYDGRTASIFEVIRKIGLK